MTYHLSGVWLHHWVIKGQRLVLECVASGIPTPQVTWAKDGQDLRFHNNTRFLLSNLLIDAAGEGDSGTYMCRADNGMGSEGTATVLYDVQVFEPPQVTVELLQQEVYWGESVRFSCQARGKPAPSVIWLRNSQPLSASPRHRLSARLLRVVNVGPQDDGLYQCMAENGVGSSQAAARLVTLPTGIPSRSGKLPSILRPDKVLREDAPEKPGVTGSEPTQDCSELAGPVSVAEAPVILSQPRTVKADFYELTWKPRHDGGSPVMEYVVKYRKIGEPPVEWTSSRISGSLHKLTLAKLQPASLYEVEMSAKNCAGLGQPAMMTFRTGKGRRSPGGQNEPPKTPPVPSPRLSPPEAPDKPTISMATETSAYVTWIPRGNRGFPIQSFRVEFKKLKGKGGGDWEVAVANIPPQRLSVEITGLEKGTSYRFRVVAVNVIGASPPTINETTIILKWTYTAVNNTPIYGFYIFYRPTDSDNDSDYKKDVVEGDRYWHSITDLQPETAYDIKMQCFNEGGESEFGNVVILETKARLNQRPSPSEPSSHRPVHPGGPVPRPSDLPYLIVGVVLGALVFIIVAFIPFCLWRAWAKQKETSDLCFPAMVPPVSSCQYTMVPLQGLALVGHCPLDSQLPPRHAAYQSSEEYTPNGKHPQATQYLPGLHQDDVECDMEGDMECDTLLSQTMNGQGPVYRYSNSEPDYRAEDCCLPDDSTLQLLNTSEQPISTQILTGNGHVYNRDFIQEDDRNQDNLACSPTLLLSLEESSTATTSTATTPESHDALSLQEVYTLQSETLLAEQGTSDLTDA
ncbi:hypothetical protein UPYG_G00073400 [Umbra pygmaea]|uniref:Brother of CDO n=1 Tax=Umbra pygmaea TaxID=75934 RepID=A0ABD0Y1N0_UMBPY